MAARTLIQMRQAVYSTLAEPLNSPFGELRAGDGGASTQTTDAFIDAALNKRLAEIARTCVPVVAVVTGVTYPANALFLAANGLATTDGGSLWAVRNVFTGSPAVALRETGRAWARLYGLTAAAPDSWYAEGDGGFGLDPTPTAGVTCAVEGLEIPPVLTSGQSPAWLRGDLDELPVWGAAADLAERNAASPKFAPLVGLWQGKYDAARLKQWEKLAAQDPEMARRFFPGPPLAAGGK